MFFGIGYSRFILIGNLRILVVMEDLQLKWVSKAEKSFQFLVGTNGLFRKTML